MSLLPSLSPSSPIAHTVRVAGPEVLAPLDVPAGPLDELLEQATESRSANAVAIRAPESVGAIGEQGYEEQPANREAHLEARAL